MTTELLIFRVLHCFVLEGKFFSGNVKGGKKSSQGVQLVLTIDLRTLGSEEELGDRRTTEAAVNYRS